jgi:hypothetical protein
LSVYLFYSTSKQIICINLILVLVLETWSEACSNLNVENTVLKLHLRINKWPHSYTKEFFKRKRLNPNWPSEPVLRYIESNTALITSSASTTTDWHVDTSLAEYALFRTLTRPQSFHFYFFYLLLQNMSCSICQQKLYLFQFVNDRLFLHHFFRFFELNNFALDSTSTATDYASSHKTLVRLIELSKKFCAYLRFVLEKYATFNRPNYFDLTKCIMDDQEYALHVKSTTNASSIDRVEQEACLPFIEALKAFETGLDTKLLIKLRYNQLPFNTIIFIDRLYKSISNDNFYYSKKLKK